MSINHFSTDLPAEALWWAQEQQQQQTIIMEPNPNSPWQASSHHYRQHHQSWLSSHNPREPAPSAFRPQNPPHSFNLNREDDEEQDQEVYLHEQQQERQQQEAQLEKELMFEKPLTPSDVGKLNRLVIPKQHAEKYFPLGANSVDKGLQLSFEDESGKCWRFRYSYWNSSQSYVLTKGWSRYVKEKQLDAGDVVFFQRCRTDGDRLFIGWRRRGCSSGGGGGGDGGGGGGGGMLVQGRSGGVWSRGMYSLSGHQPYLTSSSSSSVQHGHGHGSTPANATTGVPYQPDCLHAGQVVQNQIGMPAMVNSKRLRLFGVNLECQLLDHESEPSTPDGSSSMSSQAPTPTTTYNHHHQFYYSSSANNCSSNSDPHMVSSP